MIRYCTKRGGQPTRRLVAALLLLATTGCQTWVPSTMSPSNLVTSEAPSSVRVTRTDGDVLTIREPVIRNDSIVSAAEDQIEPVGVPTRDATSVEVRRLNPGKSLLLAAGVVAIALGWTTVATGSGGGTDPGDGPLPKVGPG